MTRRTDAAQQEARRNKRKRVSEVLREHGLATHRKPQQAGAEERSGAPRSADGPSRCASLAILLLEREMLALCQPDGQL